VQRHAVLSRLYASVRNGVMTQLHHLTVSATHRQVVEWVLGPIRALWTSQDWLHHLATPDAFYVRFVSITEAADGRAEVPKKLFAVLSDSLNRLCSATGSRTKG